MMFYPAEEALYVSPSLPPSPQIQIIFLVKVTFIFYQANNKDGILNIPSVWFCSHKLDGGNFLITVYGKFEMGRLKMRALFCLLIVLSLLRDKS